MQNRLISAALATSVVTLGAMGAPVDRAHAATVTYAGFADFNDSDLPAGTKTKDVPFKAVISEDLRHTIRTPTQVFVYYSEPLIGIYFGNGFVGGGVEGYLIDPFLLTYNNGVSSGRIDTVTDQDPFLPYPDPGQTLYVDAYAQFSVSAPDGSFPLDPEKSYQRYFSKGQATGYYSVGLLTGLPDYSYSYTSIDVSFDIRSISVVGFVGPVPLPPAVSLFGSALIALGGLGYARSRLTRTIA